MKINKKILSLLFLVLCIILIGIGVFFIEFRSSTIQNPQNFISKLGQKNVGLSDQNINFAYLNPNTQRITLTNSPPINCVVIKGKNIRDLSLLKHYSIRFLSIKDSGLINLDFLNGMNCDELVLELHSNRLLTDYSALKKNKLQAFVLDGAHNFTDVSLINPETVNVTLGDTGITNLNFSAPQNLISLGLFDNGNLSDCSSFKKMVRVRNLSLSGNFSLKDYDDIAVSFPNLDGISMLKISQKSFPSLLVNNLDYVNITLWSDLVDAQNLSGKKIKKFSFVGENLSALKNVKKLIITEKAKFRISEFNPDYLSGISIRSHIAITSHKPISPKGFVWLNTLKAKGINVKIY